MDSNLLIGVDGGGTHTRARLANAKGETLATAASGSSNISINGLAISQREIAAAIRAALAQSHARAGQVRAACLGISGLHDPQERDLLARWAQTEFAPHIEVVNDIELVLAAGTPDAWGIALIGGTGSNAFAKRADGATAQTGGWGYLIGDEGSGNELGREAVRAAVRAADGRGEPTCLLKNILAFWELDDPSDLLARVYHAHADGSPVRPAELAALAPLVLEAADAGDAVARQLIAQTAQGLALHVLTLARRLFPQTFQVPLALGGGLLVGAPRIQRELLQACRGQEHEFSPVGLVPEPVDGAVILARRLLEGVS